MLFGKRLLDLLLVIPALFVFMPILLVIAILVRITHGPPVFFRQIRPGKHGKPFKMIKFRSMLDRYDAQGQLLPEKDRLTRLGRFLRSTSLDELPELWNVLKGEMSLVGPRPLKMDYLPLYNDEQQKRHDVRPGITGWAQINGRSALDWEERFRLDVWYVHNLSLGLDLKIIFLTVLKTLKQEGVATEGGSSFMPPFQGSGPRDRQ